MLRGMISNASLSAFSASNGIGPAARPSAAPKPTQVRAQSPLPPANAMPQQGKPAQPQPGQILPRGSLLNLSV
jgi:hypothetical protein